MTTNDEGAAPPEAHFARSLKEALEEKDMSQQALADEMTKRGHKFHQATVYKILRGTRKVSLGEAVDIASVLGEDLHEMTIPPHEAALRKSMVAARKAQDGLDLHAGRLLNWQRNVVELLDSRADWDQQTRETAELWRTVTPEEVLRRARARWEDQRDQHISARATAEQINAEVEEARRRRRGIDPEA